MRGRPWLFRCAACRRRVTRSLDRPTLAGVKARVKLTGGERHQPTAGKPDNVALKYHCLDCDHVGWSTHPALKVKPDKNYHPGSFADTLDRNP